MATTSGVRRVLLALAALGAAAGAAAMQGEAGLSSLASIEPGLWTLRDREGARSLPSVCVGQDREAVLQVQHRSAVCTRLVIASDPNGGTIHYTCPGAGFGRTTVRVETPRLMKLDSQGVHDGAPFGFRAEARRVGPCQGGQRSSR